MYILGLASIVEKLFRNIFFLIDDVICSQIPRLYDLIIAIARTSPISQATIADMASRIYRLLAVFMIFKVTLSLIMYIVNPDDFTDKSKGVSKLVTNIVISLAMLILTPYIFSYAYQFQTIILEDNSLAVLIFGNDINSEDNILNTAGEQMAYIAISPFVVPNANYYNCVALQTLDADGDPILNNDCFGFTDVEKYAKDEICDTSGTNKQKLCSNYTDDMTKEIVTNYAAGVQYSSHNLLFRKATITAMVSKDDFAFDYHYIISTVVGVVLVLFLITTCMDIGLRSIKLAFLQLIAPIPILSYVDPKSGKDGMFKKWYQMCLKSYALLFIKLIAIYFAIYIIGRVGKLVDIIDGSYVTTGYIRIFIIIGALMFAKNFTKILEGLGIKLDGGFQLNPFKKFTDEALGGKRILGAAGAAAAGAAAIGTNTAARGIGAFRQFKNGNIKEGFKEMGRLPFSGALGGLSAVRRGLGASVIGGKGFGESYKKAYRGAMTARTNRDDRRELGINAVDVMKENALSAMHITNSAQAKESAIKHLDEYISAGKSAKSRAEGEVDKKADMIKINGTSLGALRDYYEQLKNSQFDGSEIRNQYRDDIIASDEYKAKVAAGDFTNPGDIETYITSKLAEKETEINQKIDAARLAHSQKAAEAHGAYFKARKAVVNAYVANANKLDESTINFGADTIEGFNDAFNGAASRDEIVVSNLSKMDDLNKDYDMKKPINRNNIGDSIQRAEDEQTKIKSSKEYTKAQTIQQQASKEKK